LAEAPQYGRNQQTGKRAIAALQTMHRWAVLDRVVERPPAAEHRADQIESNVTRSRRFGIQSSSQPGAGESRLANAAGSNAGLELLFLRSRRRVKFLPGRRVRFMLNMRRICDYRP